MTDEISILNDDEQEMSEEMLGISLNELHEEVVAISSESRRGNRRVLDVLKNFGAVLDAMSVTVNNTHESVRSLPRLSAQSVDNEGLFREWSLALIEIADRIERVSNGFSRPPDFRARWWRPREAKIHQAWFDAWNMQAEALEILRNHLRSLLSRASVEHFEVLGQVFDPNTMTATEFTIDANLPDHTVVEVILPAWRHTLTHELIRVAQVRVSRVGNV